MVAPSAAGRHGPRVTRLWRSLAALIVAAVVFAFLASKAVPPAKPCPQPKQQRQQPKQQQPKKCPPQKACPAQRVCPACPEWKPCFQKACPACPDAEAQAFALAREQERLQTLGEQVPAQELGATHSKPWVLPQEWREQIVSAVPMAPAGLDWVRASRAWRRGIRAAYVADFHPIEAVVAEGAARNESYLFLDPATVPHAFFGKAAITPSLAHEHFEGAGGYKWMLYGDDDTLWFMDSVVETVAGLDPEQPHLITDHLWFWGHGGKTSPTISHPARDAPRCLPCGFDKARLANASKPLPFDPPLACPSCTQELLCKADTERAFLYHQANCTFKLRLPPQGEFLAHGGGGVILSVGLLRRMSPAYVRECMARFHPSRVMGGDTLFSHCAFATGVAPTDPGLSFLDHEYNVFDQGGQLVMNGVDLHYHYLKKGACCDARCEARLRALTTLHMRGVHFRDPAVALDMMKVVVRLRDMYLATRAAGEAAGGHSTDIPDWDSHKVCH